MGGSGMGPRPLALRLPPPRRTGGSQLLVCASASWRRRRVTQYTPEGPLPAVLDFTGASTDTTLKPASKEQAAVVDGLLAGSNVVVNAVAGSGKTTTILHVAKAMPEKQILLLTYNRRLKDTTTATLARNGITNVKAYTFHSACWSIYNNKRSHTDKGLSEVVMDDTVAPRRLAFDLLVVDEVQDMRPLFFQLTYKILRDSTRNRASAGQVAADAMHPQLLLLGDVRQTIYAFLKADCRFLTLAPTCLPSPQPWLPCSLQTTFRSPARIALFINAVMLGFPLLKVPRECTMGTPVQYITGNNFTKADYLADELLDLLHNRDLEPSDVFVLAPSLSKTTKTTPMKKLENRLVEAGVPVYASVSDDEELKDHIIHGKVVFTTFHSSKGLERKTVVVFSFDENYFRYHAKEEPHSVCPNTLYVAVTRASESLYLVAEEAAGGHLPFLRRKEIDRLEARTVVETVELQPGRRSLELPDETQFSQYSVSELVRYLPEEITNAASSLLERCVVEPFQDVDIPGEVPSTKEGLMEAVSDVTGTALPAMWEHQSSGQVSIQKHLKADKDLCGLVPPHLLEEKPETVSAYLELAAWYSFSLSGFLYKPRQLSTFDWLSNRAARECIAVIKDTVAQDEVQAFELQLSVRYGFGPFTVVISGAADMLSRGALWELKCVSHFKPEHILQLALYAWLFEKYKNNDPNAHVELKDKWLEQQAAESSRRFYLLNMRTGEQQLLTSNFVAIENVVLAILDNKLRNNQDVGTDEEFLANCEELLVPLRAPVVAGPNDRMGAEENGNASPVAPMDYASMTKADLQAILRTIKGAKISGRKDELIERLQRLSRSTS